MLPIINYPSTGKILFTFYYRLFDVISCCYRVVVVFLKAILSNVTFNDTRNPLSKVLVKCTYCESNFKDETCESHPFLTFHLLFWFVKYLSISSWPKLFLFSMYGRFDLLRPTWKEFWFTKFLYVIDLPKSIWMQEVDLGSNAHFFQ